MAWRENVRKSNLWTPKKGSRDQSSILWGFPSPASVQSGTTGSSQKGLELQPNRIAACVPSNRQALAGVKPKDSQYLMIRALSWHRDSTLLLAPANCSASMSIPAWSQCNCAQTTVRNVQEIWTVFFSVVAYPHRTQLVACRYVYIFKPGSCKFIHVYTTSFELKDTSKSSNLRFWPRQWRQWQYCPAMAERISELWHNCGNDQCNGKGANSKLPRRNRSHMVSRSCPSSICSRKLL